MINWDGSQCPVPLELPHNIVSMALSRLNNKVASAVRSDVTGRLAAGPPTGGALAALQTDTDHQSRIATFRTGLKFPRACTNPTGLALKKGVTAWRKETTRLRLRGRTDPQFNTITLPRSKIVKQLEKLAELVGTIRAESEEPAAQKPLQSLERVVNESLGFAKTRPAKVVNWNFGELVRYAVETAALAAHALEGSPQTPVNPSTLRARAEQARIELEKKNAINRAIASSRHNEPSDFNRLVGELLRSAEEETHGGASGSLSTIARTLTRYFFAHRNACLEVLDDAIEKYADNPSSDALARLLDFTSRLEHRFEPRHPLVKNPFSTSLDELQELTQDLSRFLSSKHVLRNYSNPDVINAIRGFSKMLHLTSDWQAWCSPGAELYGREDVERLAERLADAKPKLSSVREFVQGLSKWWKLRSALLHVNMLGVVLDFRYRGGDKPTWEQYREADQLTESSWDRFAPQRWFKSVRDHQKHAFTKLAQNIEKICSEYSEKMGFLTPAGEPLRLSQFRRSQGTGAPESVIDEIVALQETLRVDPEDPRPQMGLLTIVSKDELKARVADNDATILCIRRGPELIAAYVMCCDEAKFSDEGYQLVQHLVEAQGRPEGPVVECALAVKRRGTEMLRRSHGEHPYDVIHHQLLGAIQGEFPFEAAVNCVAICRKEPIENTAIHAHRKRGWGSLEDVTYTDKDGLKNHVLHLEINPVNDLFR